MSCSCSRSSPANGSHRRPGLLFLPPGEDGEGRRPRGKAGRPGGDRGGGRPPRFWGTRRAGRSRGASRPPPCLARRGSGRQEPRGGPGTAGGRAGTPLPSPRGNANRRGHPAAPATATATRGHGRSGPPVRRRLETCGHFGAKSPQVVRRWAWPGLAWPTRQQARPAVPPPPQAALPLPPSISFLPLNPPRGASRGVPLPLTPPEVHPEVSCYP